MSITSGFEEKAGYGIEQGFYVTDVLALLDHARSIEAQNEELRAMLRKHQWCMYDQVSGLECCPECDGAKSIPVWVRCTENQGHSHDCALAKLLG